MAEILKWGKLPFGVIKQASEWVNNKAVHKLINGCVAIAPANGYKSQTGNPQYDAKGTVAIELATYTFSNGLLIGQTKRDRLESIIQYSPVNDDNNLDKWHDLGCVIAIVCAGNKHLEFMNKHFQDYLLTGTVEVNVNNDGELPDESIVKELIEVDADEWDSSALEELFLPNQILVGEMVKPVSKFFKLADKLKTLEELQAIAKDLKIENTAISGDKKQYSRSGGGAVVTVNSYESSMERYTAFLKMLGLPDDTTIIKLFELSYADRLVQDEVNFAAAFCKIKLPSFNHVDTYIVTSENIGSGEVYIDSETSELFNTVVELIAEKLSAKKIPADWQLDITVSDDWLNAIKYLLDNVDVNAIAFSKEVKAMLGDAAKSSLVLYDDEQILKIAKAYGME